MGVFANTVSPIIVETGNVTPTDLVSTGGMKKRNAGGSRLRSKSVTQVAGGSHLNENEARKMLEN